MKSNGTIPQECGSSESAVCIPETRQRDGHDLSEQYSCHVSPTISYGTAVLKPLSDTDAVGKLGGAHSTPPGDASLARSWSSDTDPGDKHVRDFKAAMEADRECHQALRLTLQEILPKPPASADTDVILRTSPHFDPVEADKFKAAAQFPVYTRRWSRKSLLAAVNNISVPLSARSTISSQPSEDTVNGETPSVAWQPALSHSSSGRTLSTASNSMSRQVSAGSSSGAFGEGAGGGSGGGSGAHARVSGVPLLRIPSASERDMFSPRSAGFSNLGSVSTSVTGTPTSARLITTGSGQLTARLGGYASAQDAIAVALLPPPLPPAPTVPTISSMSTAVPTSDPSSTADTVAPGAETDGTIPP